MLDTVAWIILISIWIFGGAVLFQSNGATYRHVLAGWAMLNAFAIGIVLLSFAGVWALLRALAP